MSAESEVQCQIVLVSDRSPRFYLSGNRSESGKFDSGLGTDRGVIDGGTITDEPHAQPVIGIALVLENPSVGYQIDIAMIVVISPR